MRVMTFNIQHCHAWNEGRINIPLFAKTIRRLRADVCGLNEVRGKGPIGGYTDQVGKIKRRLWYRGVFGEAIKVRGTSPYGNAIVSRKKIREWEVIHISDECARGESSHFEHRAVLRTVIRENKKDITFLVCHMGLSVAERRCAVKTICDILDCTDTPVILMGDFNTTPDAEELCPIYERMSDTDALAEDPGAPTFASYEPKTKIDYIFYRGLKCTSVQTVPEVVSDHFPIIADFEV